MSLRSELAFLPHMSLRASFAKQPAQPHREIASTGKERRCRNDMSWDECQCRNDMPWDERQCRNDIPWDEHSVALTGYTK